MNEIAVKWCGLVDYQQGLSLQQVALEEIRLGSSCGCILGLEHNSVITMGKRALEASDLRVSLQQLETEKIQIAKVDRGGQATLHSPGQLVIYPILSVESVAKGVKQLVQGFLESVEGTLQFYGVREAKAQYEQAGVYVHDSKIAFCGLRIIEGVSTHGISININNDLGLFRNIRSCGVNQAALTSLELQGVQVSPQQFFIKWCEIYKKKIGDP